MINLGREKNLTGSSTGYGVQETFHGNGGSIRLWSWIIKGNGHPHDIYSNSTLLLTSIFLFKVNNTQKQASKINNMLINIFLYIYYKVVPQTGAE